RCPSTDAGSGSAAPTFLSSRQSTSATFIPKLSSFRPRPVISLISRERTANVRPSPSCKTLAGPPQFSTEPIPTRPRQVFIPPCTSEGSNETPQEKRSSFSLLAGQLGGLGSNSRA